MSETEELLFNLGYGGLRCRVTKRGRLIVAPRSRLSPAWRLAIERHKDGIVGLLLDRDDRFTGPRRPLRNR